MRSHTNWAILSPAFTSKSTEAWLNITTPGNCELICMFNVTRATYHHKLMFIELTISQDFQRNSKTFILHFTEHESWVYLCSPCNLHPPHQLQCLCGASRPNQTWQETFNKFRIKISSVTHSESRPKAYWWHWILNPTWEQHGHMFHEALWPERVQVT